MSNETKYAEEARVVLRVLIRQAKANQPISYKNVWRETGVYYRNPLNMVLEKMGSILVDLSGSTKWKHPRIPGLGVIVLRGGKKLPRITPDNADSWHKFINEEYHSDDDGGLHREKEVVFNYKHWDDVLKAFNLKPYPAPITNISASRQAVKKWRERRCGGESREHKQLKENVAQNPDKYGFTFSQGETEHPLLSGDSLDVFFEGRKKVVGVEVKSRISGKEDIQRGLFQCVKYQAVLEAEQRALGTYKDVSTFLVLEENLPPDLVSVASVLGVQIVQKKKKRKPSSA